MFSSNDLFRYLCDIWDWIDNVKVTQFDLSQEHLKLPYSNYLYIVGATEVSWFDNEHQATICYRKSNGTWHLCSDTIDPLANYFE